LYCRGNTANKLLHKGILLMFEERCLLGSFNEGFTSVRQSTTRYKAPEDSVPQALMVSLYGEAE
jgi:hypothetical protein